MDGCGKREEWITYRYGGMNACGKREGCMDDIWMDRGMHAVKGKEGLMDGWMANCWIDGCGSRDRWMDACMDGR